MGLFERTGIKLSIPYNHDMALIEGLEQFIPDIENVYFPPPPGIMGTGRLWNGPDGSEYETRLPELILAVKGLGVQPELLLNSIWADAKDRGTAIEFTGRMAELGVGRVIAADLDFAVALRREFPDMKLTVSCVAFAHNAVRAAYWRDFAGADRVVIDPSINKNLSRIRAIAGLGLEIELMPANCCMPWCPFQAPHYFLVSRELSCAEGGGGHEAFCRPYRTAPENVWRQFLCEVVPGDIPRYAGIVNFVKITGRDHFTKDILRRIALYIECESRRHPEYGYIEPPEVFDLVTSCGECTLCGRCREIFEAANPSFKAIIESGSD